MHLSPVSTLELDRPENEVLSGPEVSLLSDNKMDGILAWVPSVQWDLLWACSVPALASHSARIIGGGSDTTVKMWGAAQPKRRSFPSLISSRYHSSCNAQTASWVGMESHPLSQGQSELTSRGAFHGLPILPSEMPGEPRRQGLQSSEVGCFIWKEVVWVPGAIP